MPCPFFEPREVAADAHYPKARLPLLEEYDGFCHAADEIRRPPRELRFACCNHGYSRGSCPHFPTSENRSALRFDVLVSNPDLIELLLVSESEHFPINWARYRYCVAAGTLEPEPADICTRAQIMAFCRSYLRRFSA
jgi:hypothetical protein